MMNPDPNPNPDPEKLRRELAEDLGLGPGTFLDRKLDQELLPHIGRELRELIREKLVKPEQVKNLHPEISDIRAQVTADELNRGILRDVIERELGIRVQTSDIQQPIAGSLVATSQSLAQVCFALGTSSSKIIEQARGRQWSGEDPRSDSF